MQHAILLGEYDLHIDDKNRLLIPVEIRRALLPESDDGNGSFYLVVGPVNRKPWLFPQKSYESIVSRIQPDLAPNQDVLEFNQLVFAMASRVECDKQGRILVPPKILARTGTGREVTMIGTGDHLEIWNRSDWEAQFERNLGRIGELTDKIRSTRETQS